jgi:hypothetical protein
MGKNKKRMRHLQDDLKEHDFDTSIERRVGDERPMVKVQCRNKCGLVSKIHLTETGSVDGNWKFDWYSGLGVGRRGKRRNLKYVYSASKWYRRCLVHGFALALQKLPVLLL